MDPEKLSKIFEFTNEVLLTCNPDGNTSEDHRQIIQRLNDELWKAGYMTWIVQRDGKPHLSVRPHRNDCSLSSTG
ncbi:hypothetical protein ACFL6S_24870 [Candidatus Poribacteria bacterium]